MVHPIAVLWCILEGNACVKLTLWHWHFQLGRRLQAQLSLSSALASTNGQPQCLFIIDNLPGELLCPARGWVACQRPEKAKHADGFQLLMQGDVKDH